jgi:hypothetical protein
VESGKKKVTEREKKPGKVREDNKDKSSNMV